MWYYCVPTDTWQKTGKCKVQWRVQINKAMPNTVTEYDHKNYSKKSARSHLCTLNSSTHFLWFRHSRKVEYVVTLTGILVRLHITSGRDEAKLHPSQHNYDFQYLIQVRRQSVTMSWKWIRTDDCCESRESTGNAAKLTAATQFLSCFMQLTVLTFKVTWLCNVRYKSPWTFSPNKFVDQWPEIIIVTTGNYLFLFYTDRCFERKSSLAFHSH